MMNCSHCELCGATHTIFAPGSSVNISQIAELVITPLAIVSTVFVAVAVFAAKGLHFNVRLLLECMLGSMLISNAGVLLTSLQSLYASLIADEDDTCDLLLARNDGTVSFYIYALGGIGLVLSSLFFAIERTVATIFYENYENGKRWLGVLLVTIQCLLCVLALSRPRQPGPPYPYPGPELRDTEIARATNKIFFFVNAFSLAVFAVLWIVNAHRSTWLALPDSRFLSARFQLKENIDTTRLMIPVLTCDCLLMCSSFAIYWFFLPHYTPQNVVTLAVLEEVARYAPWAEMMIVLMPATSLFVCTLFPFLSMPLRRSLFRLLRQSHRLPAERGESVSPAVVRDTYFEKLQGQWHTPRQP